MNLLIIIFSQEIVQSVCNQLTPALPFFHSSTQWSGFFSTQVLPQCVMTFPLDLFTITRVGSMLTDRI